MVFLVRKPVADLLLRPYQCDQGPLERFRLTQVLYNERLLKKDERGEFYYVQAIEQKKYYSGWKGYTGWIKKEHLIRGELKILNGVVEKKACPLFSDKGLLYPLLFGTKIRIVGEQGTFFRIELPEGGYGFIEKACVKRLERGNIKRELVEKAKIFLDTPYLWGGRSIYIPEIKEVRTGVDCSGLVNLLFRVCGLDLPRDSEDQFRVTKPVEFCELKAGDLIFLSKRGEKKVCHVMLYLGDGKILEARGEGEGVRVVTAQERFGFEIEGVRSEKILFEEFEGYARTLRL